MTTSDYLIQIPIAAGIVVAVVILLDRVMKHVRNGKSSPVSNEEVKRLIDVLDSRNSVPMIRCEKLHAAIDKNMLEMRKSLEAHGVQLDSLTREQADTTAQNGAMRAETASRIGEIKSSQNIILEYITNGKK